MIRDPVWKGHRSTDKRYAGDNRLMSLRVLIAETVWHLDVAHHILKQQGVSRVRLFDDESVRELGLNRRETGCPYLP